MLGSRATGSGEACELATAPSIDNSQAAYISCTFSVEARALRAVHRNAPLIVTPRGPPDIPKPRPACRDAGVLPDP